MRTLPCLSPENHPWKENRGEGHKRVKKHKINHVSRREYSIFMMFLWNAQSSTGIESDRKKRWKEGKRWKKCPVTLKFPSRVKRPNTDRVFNHADKFQASSSASRLLPKLKCLYSPAFHNSSRDLKKGTNHVQVDWTQQVNITAEKTAAHDKKFSFSSSHEDGRFQTFVCVHGTQYKVLPAPPAVIMASWSSFLSPEKVNSKTFHAFTHSLGRKGNKRLSSIGMTPASARIIAPHVKRRAFTKSMEEKAFSFITKHMRRLIYWLSRAFKNIKLWCMQYFSLNIKGTVVFFQFCRSQKYLHCFLFSQKPVFNDGRF